MNDEFDIKNLQITEEIKINDINEIYERDNLIAKRIGENGNPKTLSNIRGIILHQDMIYSETLEEFIERMKNTFKSFHFIIDKEGIIYQLNPVTRSVPHCAFNEYSRFANDYFGDTICPIYKSMEKKHTGSPNDCTLAVCFQSCDDKSNINRKTLASLIKLCAYLINKYSPSLQVQSNVFGLYKIPKEGVSSNPQVFYNNNSFLHIFRYRSEKLRTNWNKIYNGLQRGYPTEIITKMTDKEEEKKE